MLFRGGSRPPVACRSSAWFCGQRESEPRRLAPLTTAQGLRIVLSTAAMPAHWRELYYEAANRRVSSAKRKQATWATSARRKPHAPDGGNPAPFTYALAYEAWPTSTGAASREATSSGISKRIVVPRPGLLSIRRDESWPYNTFNLSRTLLMPMPDS